jgi:multisubunit Na+/H+ antiporter MnhE subunit
MPNDVFSTVLKTATEVTPSTHTVRVDKQQVYSELHMR